MVELARRLIEGFVFGLCVYTLLDCFFAAAWPKRIDWDQEDEG